jgi:CRISPR-associated endonuclease/helicase Cas3
MTTTNNPKLLRQFQKKVRDLILQGKNVILQAPTGAGKTRAALSPFVNNLGRVGRSLPHTCLYATPLRVLSTQFHKEYQTVIAHIDKKRGTDYGRYYERLQKSPVSIQTGEQPDDPQFESLITFCTIDQLLASFLGAPFSMGGRRRANLNVAAVLGSYLVLDEYHLYPLRDEESCYGARTTVLSMLSLLQGITPFVLMTATLSRNLLDRLKVLLNAEIVTVDDEKELNEIAQGRHRYFEVANTAISAESILARHDKCSLVICNTVLRAQQCYWQLKDLAQQRGIEVVLLHSRLTTEDRAKRSEMIMEQLGPDNWKNGEYLGRDLIVVATQVVEVGLDISVQTLHTEIAPANSLIQRAGRCARFAKQEGHVIIYDLSTNEEGKRVSALPYDDKLCQNTFAALQQLDPSQPIGFREEQSLIDAVHTQDDQLLLEYFAKRRDDILAQMFTSLKEHTPCAFSSLIRDVVQTQVLIHDNPDEAIKEMPWCWQSFALHPASLASHMKFFEEMRNELDLDWICKEAVAIEEENPIKDDKREPDVDNRVVTQYKWPCISYIDNSKAMELRLRGTIMVALPNALATYHPELGFILRDDWESLWPQWTIYQSTLPVEASVDGTPSRKKERGNKSGYKPIVRRSYQEHIGGLVSAYNNGISQQVTYVASKLETLLKLPEGSIDHAIRLAIACHDLGKLSEQWQGWALEWQQLLYERMHWQPYQQDAKFFFAKTDFDSKSPDQCKWQHDTKTKRPNHACESVILGLSLISDSLGMTSPDGSKYVPLWRATCGAIARHHTPTADEYHAIQLTQGAHTAIEEALELARQGQPWAYNTKLISTKSINAGKLQPNSNLYYITCPSQGRLQELETWLYFVIVRALRLADQRADDFCY